MSLKETLEQQIDVNEVTYRKQAWNSDRQIPYLETHFVINQANKIFGFDGWEYGIVDLTKVTFRDVEKENKKGWEFGVQCRLKVRVRIENEWLEREDVGYGSGVDYTSPAAAYESAGKEAVSDALKRALRSFGNQFGNSLYDKEFHKELPGMSGGATTRTAAKSAAPKPQYGGAPSGKPMTGQITENQIKFAKKLAADKGKKLEDILPEGKKLEELTKQQGSEIIDKLNKE